MTLSRREQLNHPLWISKVKEIKDRDRHSCVICGDNMHQLDIHHLCYLPDLLAWEYDNELMVTVCRKHHDQLTFDLPKIAGLISFQCFLGKLDLTNTYEILKNLQ